MKRPRTLAEIRAGIVQPVDTSTVTERARRGKEGRGAYVAPYDGPEGEDNRCRGPRRPAATDEELYHGE